MKNYSALLEEAKSLPRSPIHSFHRYFGKLIPAIPHFAIKEFTQPGDLVLDPFCGSGTTLVEAKLLGRQSAGIDVNPLACLLAAAKTTSCQPEHLKEAARNVQRRARALLANPADLSLPYCVNMDHWFRPEIQKRLAALQTAILEQEDTPVRDFLLAVFSAIIRAVSNADPRHIFPGYTKRLRRLDEQGATRPDPAELFLRSAEKRAGHLDAYNTIPAETCRVFRGDARRPAELGLPSASLIVTNPPYISSIRYLETAKLEMSWLGMLPGQKQYLALDRQVMGSERFYRHEYRQHLKTGIDRVDNLTAQLHDSGQQKMAYTVARFFLDLDEAIKGMASLLGHGGHLVVKISDSHVRGLDIPTHSIFSDTAASNGLKPIASFTDPIRTRSLLTRRNTYSGLIEHDWILIFRK